MELQMGYFLQIFYIVLAFAACGPRIDTGRNHDPSQWPVTPPESESGNARGSSSCFESTPSSIPSELQALCTAELKSNAVFAKIAPILCDQGKMLTAINNPSCGWDGSPRNMNNYLHRFYTEKDTTKDYEDVAASIVHAPVSADRYTRPISLAFENYEEFKRQGFQWTAGTREIKNLSSTKWEQGIQYRFRADKDVYEVGYQGQTKRYQLSPTLSAQINYATGDFERITKFAQVVLFSEQPDHSTLALRLENRAVSSQGLFERAKKSALELDYEALEKGYRNATTP
jgi:hypothetical protein